MTDTSEFQASFATKNDVFQSAAGPALVEKYWGFTVRNNANQSAGMILLQFTSYLFGGAFVAAALGFWIVPSALVQVDTWSMRIALSGLFMALGILLIGYANQGRMFELEFDQNLGEVRAVTTNRKGKSRLIAQYGFDSFDEMTIVPCGEGQVVLALVPAGGGDPMFVAQGTEPQIGALYTRLDCDLLRAGPVRKHRAVRPSFA